MQTLPNLRKNIVCFCPLRHRLEAGLNLRDALSALSLHLRSPGQPAREVLLGGVSGERRRFGNRVKQAWASLLLKCSCPARHGAPGRFVFLRLRGGG